jgi:LmbE family N-acetylglucosaminyl deacetylase
MKPSQLKPLLGRTLVIVAHPDDETISCGGLLQHIHDPCVVFCTDGAPEDPYFWERFGSRQRYIEVREEEAVAALAEVGVKQVEFLARQSITPLCDQLLYQSLPSAFAALANVVDRRRPECLLTLAYEGGHPDHDCCSFLAAQMAKQHSVPAWEAPLYHRDENGGGVHQRFVDEEGEVLEHVVSGEELQAKLRMLGCYKSQFETLPPFNTELERFRPQAAYDYTRRPHPGKLNYELWQWRMTPEEVCSAFVEFNAVTAPAPVRK